MLIDPIAIWIKLLYEMEQAHIVFIVISNASFVWIFVIVHFSLIIHGLNIFILHLITFWNQFKDILCQCVNEWIIHENRVDYTLLKMENCKMNFSIEFLSGK